jgi:hypothetical protein
MSLVYAYRDRGITRNITIQDADGNTITPHPADKVRATIGRSGETAKFTITSGTPTAAGSSFTMGAVNVLRLDASDLNFSAGTYTLFIELQDSADASEWKNVSRQVFILEDTETVKHVADPSEVLFELGYSDSATDELRGIVQKAIVSAEGAVKRYLHYDPILRERTEFHPQQAFQAQISRGIWEVMEQRATLRQVSESATNELQLQYLPVREVTMYVWRDYDGRSGTQVTSFPASSLVTQGPGYWPNYDTYDSSGLRICRDGILRTIGLWPTTPGTVKVQYTAGYTPDEFRGQAGIVDASGIWETVVQEAARRVRRMMSTKKSTRLGLVAGVMSSENLGEYSYSLDGASIGKVMNGDLTGESMERLSEFVNLGASIGS